MCEAYPRLKDESRRGLGLGRKRQRAKNRDAYIAAVVKEQRRQHELGMQDEEGLARVAMRFSQKDQASWWLPAIPFLRFSGFYCLVVVSVFNPLKVVHTLRVISGQPRSMRIFWQTAIMNRTGQTSQRMTTMRTRALADFKNTLKSPHCPSHLARIP